VHLIDLPAATSGRCARLVADPESQQAVCYIE